MCWLCLLFADFKSFLVCLPWLIHNPSLIITSTNRSQRIVVVCFYFQTEDFALCLWSTGESRTFPKETVYHCRYLSALSPFSLCSWTICCFLSAPLSFDQYLRQASKMTYRLLQPFYKHISLHWVKTPLLNGQFSSLLSYRLHTGCHIIISLSLLGQFGLLHQYIFIYVLCLE